MAALAASTSPATAAVTIGQLPTFTANPASCGTSSMDWVQSAASGNPYVAPANGMITSWSTEAGDFDGQVWAMKVFRPVPLPPPSPQTYAVVGRDVRELTPDTFNTFTASIPVRPGDVLGVNPNVDVGSGVQNNCGFFEPGVVHVRSGSLAEGVAGAFGVHPASFRLNITAVVEPYNAFLLGKLMRNKKRGTATLTVEDIPNPGKLVLAGKGVRRVAKTVSAPGNVKLKIRAKGKKKRRLNQRGRVRVRPRFKFTPTGGEPWRKSLKVTLIKRR